MKQSLSDLPELQDPPSSKTVGIPDRSLGFAEGWISIVINTALFALKLWVGIASSSVAMVADAWHTLSDTLTSMVVIIGFWMARKPADGKHPFGHGRAEFISAIVISTMLGMVGLHFIVRSIEQLRVHNAAVFGRTAIAVFLASVVLKEALAQFAFWAGKKIDAPSLTADGWHHRSDAIASALIVAGAFLSPYFWWTDGVLGLVVSILIIKAAIDIFRETSDMLLGERMDRALEVRIRMIVHDIVGDECRPHHFHIHNYRNHKEVTFHLFCPPEEKIESVHEKIDSVEEALKTRLNIEATIHVEPLGT
ncbi:MAG: cation transporter [Deltaproteobacteria bacterium]|nr:cation transporter [Deltaproteobacteria bacterium]